MGKPKKLMSSNQLPNYCHVLGWKKTLKWQQIFFICSSKSIVKHIEIASVFCNLGQFSSPSFVRSFTPTRKYR